MDKREGLSIFQIFILVVGIVAISYAIGGEIKIVGADHCPEGSSEAYSGGDCIYNNNLNRQKIPSATLPTSISKSQKYYEEIFGKFSAAPKGATGGSAETKYTIEAGKTPSSGFGYSVSNIIGNAAYAAGIFIFIKSVGGMFVDDDNKVNAVATAVLS